jgi:hypothetical protein
MPLPRWAALLSEPAFSTCHDADCPRTGSQRPPARLNVKTGFPPPKERGQQRRPFERRRGYRPLRNAWAWSLSAAFCRRWCRCRMWSRIGERRGGRGAGTTESSCVRGNSGLILGSSPARAPRLFAQLAASFSSSGFMAPAFAGVRREESFSFVASRSSRRKASGRCPVAEALRITYRLLIGRRCLLLAVEDPDVVSVADVVVTGGQ